jgi:hypothetical protein
LENQSQKTKNRLGKYSFVNRTITDRNKIPEGVIGTSQGKTHIFRTKVRKVKPLREVKAIKSKK